MGWTPRQKVCSMFVSVLTATVLGLVCAAPALANPGNDDIGKATSLSLNTPYSSTSMSSSDNDWYRLRLDRQGTLQLSVAHSNYSKGGWTIKLYDENNDTIESFDSDGQGSGATGTKIGLPAGTYFIKVDPWSNSTNNRYTLKASYAAASNWETEFNDGIGAADGLAPNATINASSIDSSDNDWFAVQIPSQGTVQVSLNNAQDSRGGWTVGLYTSGNELIQSFDCDASSPSHAGTVIGVPSGKYFVKVDPWSNTGGHTYSLKVNYQATTSWETEFNNGVESPDSIAVGKAISGSSISSTDNDWFVFNLSAQTNVRVSLSNAQSSRGGWVVTLYDGNADKVTDFGNWSASQASHSSSTLGLNAGRYFLKVDPMSNSTGLTYSLRVEKVTPPASSGQQQAATQTMYRLYNRYTGEHFYTSSTSERDSLVKVGWEYEGVGWIAPKSSKTPVYRLYNPYVKGGDHHYTMSRAEYDQLHKLGWKQEGIGWYSDDSKRVPVYRQYNPYATTGTHNYTVSKSENDQLVKLGWRAEGTGWYAVRTK